MHNNYLDLLLDSENKKAKEEQNGIQSTQEAYSDKVQKYL